MTRCRLVALSSFAALLAGCGSGELTMTDPVTVTGTALLPDGKPAKFVNLEFYALDTRSSMGHATTDEAGKFKPETNGKPGLVPGEHRVAAIATAKTGSKLDGAIGNDITSPLRAKVESGKELTITLKAP